MNGLRTVLGAADLIAFVAATDLKRARAFYEGVLGLLLLTEDPYALVFDANGVLLRVAKVQVLNPAIHTVLGWRVTDIAAILEALGDKGVRAERYSGVQQDRLGIWATPTGAQVAWFKDPEGNVLSLTQF